MSFFYATFNYCPLAWMSFRAKSLNKVESLQKRALRFLYEDYNSSCEQLLVKAKKETIKINRLRSLCIDIYKSINNINPTYMNETFKLGKTSRVVRRNYKLNLDVPAINRVSFGDKSLRCCRPNIWNSNSNIWNSNSNIWNSLPFLIKFSENLETFKNIAKNWNGVSCKCKVSQYH